MLLANREGVVISSGVINLNAAGVANAAVVFTPPVLAGALVGTKSAVIRKVSLYSNAAGNTQVLIGNGVGGAFVALLPALDSFSGLLDTYGPDDLPEVESFAAITAYPVALIALTSIDIEIELLIRG